MFLWIRLCEFVVLLLLFLLSNVISKLMSEKQDVTSQRDIRNQ